MKNINFNKEPIPKKGFYQIGDIAGGRIFWVYFGGQKNGNTIKINPKKNSFAEYKKLDESYNSYEEILEPALWKNFIREYIGNLSLNWGEDSMYQNNDVEIILNSLSQELNDKIKKEAIKAIEDEKELVEFTEILTQKLKKEASSKFVVKGYSSFEGKENVYVGAFLYKHSEKIPYPETESFFKFLKLTPETFYNLCRGMKKEMPIVRIKIIPIPEESITSKKFNSLRYVGNH